MRDCNARENLGHINLKQKEAVTFLSNWYRQMSTKDGETSNIPWPKSVYAGISLHPGEHLTLILKWQYCFKLSRHWHLLRSREPQINKHEINRRIMYTPQKPLMMAKRENKVVVGNLEHAMIENQYTCWDFRCVLWIPSKGRVSRLANTCSNASYWRYYSTFRSETSCLRRYWRSENICAIYAMPTRIELDHGFCVGSTFFDWFDASCAEFDELYIMFFGGRLPRGEWKSGMWAKGTSSHDYPTLTQCRLL